MDCLMNIFSSSEGAITQKKIQTSIKSQKNTDTKKKIEKMLM